jgi:hypothetical protein
LKVTATWKQFSTSVLRSLPVDATFADRQRALKAAGKLWRGEVSLKRNPQNSEIAEWKRSSVDPEDGELVNYKRTQVDPFVVYGLYGLAAAGLYLLWKQREISYE